MTQMQHTFVARIHYTFDDRQCTESMTMTGEYIHGMTSRFQEKFLTEHVDGCVIQRIEVKQFTF